MLIVRWINKASKGLGYLYLLFYPHERLVKIGVSNTPRIRYIQIQKDMPRRIYFIAAFPVFDPYPFERYIGNKFGRYKKEPKGAGPRAGRTEFYKFGLISFAKCFVLILLKCISFYLFWTLCIPLMVWIIIPESRVYLYYLIDFLIN